MQTSYTVLSDFKRNDETRGKLNLWQEALAHSKYAIHIAFK